MTEQINKIKPSILENIKSQRKSLMASRSNLYATNTSYNTILQSIPQKERKLLDISREQAIKNGIYSFLLQKREESAISNAAAVSDMKVIDKAQSSLEPVTPRVNLIYLASVVASLLVMIIIISIREALNQKILYRQEIEEVTKLPVLGEIGFIKQADRIVVEEGKKTSISEAFRRIRAALPFLGIRSQHKGILVTSSIPGEGKSFIAANLAQTLALAGKKVVLVDMDLNNPSLSFKLNIDGGIGVSEFLNEQASPEAIIRQTQVNENLNFVAAGAIPSNPFELLSNGRAIELLTYLKKKYDYVIIDTAPIVPVSDAFLLSPHCDATLYVVRHKYTPKTMIERLDETLKVHPLYNAAIIFNGVRKRGFTNTNYGYGYGYHDYVNYDGPKASRRRQKPVA